MTDPVTEARVKLLHLQYKLGTPTPPPGATAVPPVSPPLQPITVTRKENPLANFIANVVGVQVKRAVTLGIGVLVGAGYLTVSQGDAQGAAITAAVSQLVLTVAYAAYDKFLKPHILKLLGLAVSDAVSGK